MSESLAASYSNSQEPAKDLLGSQQASLLAALVQKHTQSIVEQHAANLNASISQIAALAPSLMGVDALAAWQSYTVDAFQRWVLFLDILRERGNSYIEREKEGFKPVLVFDYTMVLDGRERERPVNYAVVRITPPDGYPQQREDGRPFVIIDPRAGHGSGIGGFKAESEVGVALMDGHPVYFVIFFPQPEAGQTLADVTTAEAAFIEEVQRRHPKAPAPLIIGNCQGGWASMILSATHPELTGPVVIAGAPLSYWAGEVGKNPLRYFGGLAGGAVPALLASDLGGGKFDGAGLVLNFENLNPAKTWFRKYYDVFSRVDTSAADFLEFERWWSGFYFMNENEIRWIVENLFIGNKLTRGEAVLSDGTPVDLTRIKAPIIVFASHGDNITPPQQALNWIPDLYQSADEIRARGHVIIYTLHDSIGHLGIFVSAKVASKQHKQITSVIKTIEALAPGLYELIIAGEPGNYEVAFEARSIENILALDDGRDDEAEFAAVSRLSDWASKTYELTMRPAIRTLVTPQMADALTKLHPIRQRRYVFSDQNPLMSGVAGLATEVRTHRQLASEDNPFVRLERVQAEMIEQGLNFYRDVRDAWLELTFHALYASPWMRAIGEQAPRSTVSHDITRFPEVRAAVARVAEGGFAEAVIRMLILLAQARGSVRRDRLERSNRILHSRAPFDSMALDERTRVINEQNMIVQFASDEALASLPKLLRDDVDRIRALNLTLDIAGPVDEMDAPTIAMFKRIQTVLMTMARNWHEPSYDIVAHEPGTAPDDAGERQQRRQLWGRQSPEPAQPKPKNQNGNAHTERA